MAIGDLNYSQSVHNIADPNTRIVGEKAQTSVGWMMGGGLQYALTQRWSARVSNSPDFRSHHDASLTEHNSFALIYQF